MFTADKEVLPYFKKAQSHSEGPGEYRGGGGPLRVTRYKGRSELDQAWLRAGQQAGRTRGSITR